MVHADPAGLRRLLIITSDFHLASCEAAFRWIYGLEPKAHSYELSFEPVCDPDMPAAVLGERREKDRKSLEDLLTVAERIRTMRDCPEWLFTEHGAYNALSPAFGGDGLSKGVLESHYTDLTAP